MHAQPPPKGSLEELFRHHLLESEAAAVPPSPLAWDHIENSLLLAQNEKYRRRLLVHRWAVAASLLLAVLAGGGWWHSQQQTGVGLAATTSPLTAAPSAASQPTTPSYLGQLAAANQLLGHSARTTSTGAGSQWFARSSDAGQLFIDDLVQSRYVAGGSGLAAPYGLLSEAEWSAVASYSVAVGPAARAKERTRPVVGAASHAGSLTTYSSNSTNRPIGSTATSTPVASFQAAAGLDQEELRFAYAGPYPEPQELTTAERLSENLLAARNAQLLPANVAKLPTTLAPVAVTLPPATKLRNWQYGVEYGVTAFQPNVDFTRSTSAYNSALGYNTISMTRAASAEYRANLRAGLGQRLSLRATRRLGGRWALSTGVEAAQQQASSATSAAFVGEQIADLSFVAPVTRELQPSSYRYRSVGVPLELRYGNPSKAGVSFYGRLGAIVSALLSVHSEVANNPEATRTYTFTSADTPYRRLTTLLRGGAGVRYRSDRNWALSVGPTAEAGVQSLNTEPDKSFLQQSRPYSLGLEAGFEFGCGLKPAQ